MKEGAQRIQPESDYTNPEARKSAEIHYINDFAEYSAIPGGHLKRGEYERTKNAAENPDARVNETLAINAQTYAREAGISLSDESLILYSVLRSDDELSSELLHSDQPILAEVLRMEGRAEDAKKLIAAYSPVITF